MQIASTRDALQFIWDGQDGLFEVASTPSQRNRYPKDKALASLDGMRYYGPLARKSDGSKKANIADFGNVLWADIDSLDMQERLSQIPLPPSLVVVTGGKGFWVYFKLTSAIATDTIEMLNRGLSILLDGDSCHNRDRLARIPGSRHQSGQWGRIVNFNALVYEPSELAFLASVEAAQPPPEPSHRSTRITGSFPSQWAALSGELWTYIERQPHRGEYGYDRSVMEQKIFVALAYQGWTDEQIMLFADVHGLPRHHQERAKRKSYEWTQRSIDKARAWVREHPSEDDADTSLMNGMCMTSETKGGYSHTDRHKALRLVDGTQTTTQLIQDWMTKLPSTPSYSTAHRMLKQFTGGTRPYIQKSGRLWQLTERGIHHTRTSSTT